MKTRILNLCLLAMLLLSVSCVKDSFEPNVPEIGEENPIEEEPVTAMSDLEIPSGFDFSTAVAVDLQITDGQNGVRYTVQLLQGTVYNGVVLNNAINTTLNISAAETEIVLIRNTGTNIEEILVPVTGTTLTYNH